MRVLGIDQSFTSTGISVFDDGKLIHTNLVQSDKTDNNFDRSMAVAYGISDLVIKYSPDIIALEGIPFMSRSNVTRDLAGLQYVIVAVLTGYDHMYKVGENLFIIPPTRVKKIATGTGKATKEQMFEALPSVDRNKIGKYLKSKGRYDVSDSYWIGKAGEEAYNENISDT